jgi:enediyne biosynthesis protein E4
MQDRHSRREFLARAAALSAPAVAGGLILRAAAPAPRVGSAIFEEISPSASGITWVHENAISDERYLPETLGPGCAFLDYDNDGWMDLYLVNSGPADFYKPKKPLRNALYKNNRNGTFTDVTEKAGVGAGTTFGMGVAVGDYDNDGYPDMFVTAYGRCILYHNNGDGTFTDVTEKAGLPLPGWTTSAVWFDYDNDGRLDLFVCSFVDYTSKLSCGDNKLGRHYYCIPRVFKPTHSFLFHNNGDGTFTDVSKKSGIWDTIGNYALSVAVSDLDDDGWPDIYVANDSTAATLYQNQKDGTFKDIAIEAGAALSPDGKPQAGMGVSIGDYDRDGKLDIVKTNFAGDTDSLYANLGEGNFQDRTYAAGLGINTRYLGWGVGFFDMDNDGWLDILVTNGHVYPEVSSSKAEAPYAERKYLYRNLHNGRFEDVSEKGGPGIIAPVPGRGCAFGDYDNDGDIDVIVNCVNSLPQLLRCDSQWKRSWIKVKAVGVKSNRTGIGAKVRVLAKTQKGSPDPLLQVDEVRSGGSYYSQSDLRLHFGLDQAQIVDSLEIRWPSGHVDTFRNLAVNHLYIATEGAKDPQSVVLGH